ncbi:TSUP family transporter [Bacteriovorax sp. BSW11_IV]|uniref:TSUP family transporter n=1 Tax=Bacteriovorax sp. BSW11_IV TaxID=1353529 RepID=UPI0004148221|nr:TSUP family transporter [Bacteriovorax sp. BSW11_IV]
MEEVLIFIYVVITSTISGATGMAGGVLLMAIFTGVMPLSNALILHGITQSTSNGFRALINYKHIRFKIVWPYLFGTAMAYVALTYVDFRPNKSLIFIGLGLMPFVSLIKSVGSLFDITKKGRSFICGVVVSLNQTLIGVSGGVLDIFYITAPLDRFTIVASKSFTQAIGHTCKIIFYLTIYKMELLNVSNTSILICIFAPFIGGVVGKKILKKCSDTQFVKVVRVVMLCMGVSLIYKGL